MFSTEYLVTSLIVVLIPGTGVIFTVSTALLQGRTAGGLAAPWLFGRVRGPGRAAGLAGTLSHLHSAGAC